MNCETVVRGRKDFRRTCARSYLANTLHEIACSREVRKWISRRAVFRARSSCPPAFSVKIRGVIFSSSSGCAAPSVNPSAAKIHIHSFTNPGVGTTRISLRRRFARVSGFLDQFPPRGGQPEFRSVPCARQPVPTEIRRRSGGIAGSEECGRPENGQHHHRSRMHDDVALGLHAARLDHRVAPQTEIPCPDRELRSSEFLRDSLPSLPPGR